MRKNYYAKKPQCAWIPFSVYLYPVLFLSLIKRISIFKKKTKNLRNSEKEIVKIPSKLTPHLLVLREIVSV